MTEAEAKKKKTTFKIFIYNSTSLFLFIFCNYNRCTVPESGSNFSLVSLPSCTQTENMIQEFKPEYCDTIPSDIEDGIIYISERFGIAIHLCACGCKS